MAEPPSPAPANRDEADRAESVVPWRYRARSPPAAPPVPRPLPGREPAPRPCACGWRRCARQSGSRGALQAGRVVEVGQLDARQPLADDLLDQVPLAFFLARDERERLAGGLGPTRAADAVDVVLGRDRHVEVHDVASSDDVDAAGGDVGRDEHRVLAALEPGQRQRALRLRPVAVDARGLDALPLEVRRQAIGAVLGAREHQRLRHHAARQQRREQRALQVLRHRVHRLRDADGRRGLPRQVDRRRVVEEFAGQADDRRRHRGAEEQRLALRRAGASASRLMSGRKPMSSMRSASSSTRNSRPDSLA